MPEFDQAVDLSTRFLYHIINRNLIFQMVSLMIPAWNLTFFIFAKYQEGLLYCSNARQSAISNFTDLKLIWSHPHLEPQFIFIFIV